MEWRVKWVIVSRFTFQSTSIHFPSPDWFPLYDLNRFSDPPSCVLFYRVLYLQVPLKDNGINIDVTEMNKIEYVRLLVEWHCEKSILNQVHSLQKGFYELMPKDKINIFTVQELKLLIGGVTDVDVNLLRNVCIYKGMLFITIILDPLSVQSFPNDGTNPVHLVSTTSVSAAFVSAAFVSTAFVSTSFVSTLFWFVVFYIQVDTKMKCHLLLLERKRKKWMVTIQWRCFGPCWRRWQSSIEEESCVLSLARHALTTRVPLGKIQKQKDDQKKFNTIFSSNNDNDSLILFVFDLFIHCDVWSAVKWFLDVRICRSQEEFKALPTAHTCFNQLVLPAYQSCEQLRERLTYALDESGASFGMTWGGCFKYIYTVKK